MRNAFAAGCFIRVNQLNHEQDSEKESHQELNSHLFFLVFQQQREYVVLALYLHLRRYVMLLSTL